MSIEKLYELFQAHPVVTTDSRKCPKGSMFFALKGANFDGNQYAAKALEAGCSVAVVDNPAIIPDTPKMYANRSARQYPVSVSQPDKSERFKNISVEVYGENGDIFQGTRKYSSGGTITDIIEKDDSGKEITKKGIVLISVASGENNAGVKKFRRALAYILEKNDVSDGEGKYYKQIYFMNTLSSNE